MQNLRYWRCFGNNGTCRYASLKSIDIAQSFSFTRRLVSSESEQTTFNSGSGKMFQSSSFTRFHNKQSKIMSSSKSENKYWRCFGNNGTCRYASLKSIDIAQSFSFTRFITLFKVSILKWVFFTSWGTSQIFSKELGKNYRRSVDNFNNERRLQIRVSEKTSWLRYKRNDLIISYLNRWVNCSVSLGYEKNLNFFDQYSCQSCPSCHCLWTKKIFHLAS
jgi:hypothetical protein